MEVSAQVPMTTFEYLQYLQFIFFSAVAAPNEVTISVDETIKIEAHEITENTKCQLLILH